ncbi:claudin 10-like 2 isoform X2 [Festucalex cinctus]
MALCAVHHGHGLLEDHPAGRSGRLVHHQGGLVLVQPVEGLLHRLHGRHQLPRLPGALECHAVCPGRARLADVRPDFGLPRRHLVLPGHGMHLPRRRRAEQGQDALCRRSVSFCGRVARNTFALNLAPGLLRYDLGPPIFLGLVGSFFILLGALFYAVTVFRVVIPKSQVIYAYGGGTSMDPRLRGRSMYTGGYYRPNRLYGTYYGSARSSSSKISKLSATTPEKFSARDAFV